MVGSASNNTGFLYYHIKIKIKQNAEGYMLSAANKYDCQVYAKILYVQAVTHEFADVTTHINALAIFEKTYGDLDWAWHAYNEIKRLGALNTEVCALMITIALNHN